MRRLLTVLLCLTPAVAAAQSATTGKDGYELFIQCDSDNSAFNQGVCLGDLGALVDLEAATAEPDFCVPADEPLSVLQRAYVAAFQSGGIPRGTSATAAALQILAAAFPCQ